jgi:hypothetical protein
VVPTFRETPFSNMPQALLADLGVPLLLGGIWMWAWSTQMRKANAPIVPQHDPRLEGFWPLPELETAGSTSREVHAHG